LTLAKNNKKRVKNYVFLVKKSVKIKKLSTFGKNAKSLAVLGFSAVFVFFRQTPKPIEFWQFGVGFLVWFWWFFLV